MKKVFIRPNDIANCLETKDACIVETSKGKKWVCKRFFRDEMENEWNTLEFVRQHLNFDFITLELMEKGKGE